MTPEAILDVIVNACADRMLLSLKGGGYLLSRLSSANDPEPDRWRHVWQHHRIGYFDSEIKIPTSFYQALYGLDRVLIPANYNAIVFPITTYYACLKSIPAVIGFQLRSVSEPRQLSTFLIKDYESIYGRCFGLESAIPDVFNTREVFLTEGPMDALAMSRYKKNTISLMTNTLSEKTARILRRFAERFFFALDNDEEGEKGTLAGMDLVQRLGGVAVKINYGKAKDPALAVNSYPKDFETLITSI